MDDTGKSLMKARMEQCQERFRAEIHKQELVERKFAHFLHQLSPNHGLFPDDKHSFKRAKTSVTNLSKRICWNNKIPIYYQTKNRIKNLSTSELWSSEKMEAVAKFKPKSKNEKGVQSFDKLTDVGWVNGPLALGVLTRVKNDENRVVFEFRINKTKFNAWSAKGKGKKNNWGKENLHMLKAGYSYVLKGTIMAQCHSAKYFPSNNSNSKFQLQLSQVQIVEKMKQKGKSVPKNTSFEEINQLIETETPFDKDVKNVKILSGDVRRYQGCQVCCYGVSKPNNKGQFYCKVCKKYSKKRRHCIIVRNLSLEDKKGDVLNNAICFQKGCEGILGTAVVKRLCESFSDLDLRSEFNAIIGAKITLATIKHQKHKTYGYRITVDNVKRIVKPEKALRTKKNDGDHDHDDGDGQQSDPSLATSTTVPPSSSTICPCEEDEIDEDDEDDAIPLGESNDNNSASTPCTSSSLLSLRNTQNFENTNFMLDRQYQLTPTPEGHIGLAIILNMNFSNSPHLKPREGTQHNVKRLLELFPKLRVRVFKGKALEDVTKEQFEKETQELKAELIRGDYSSFFFVLMSHGTLHTVRLGDHTRINVYNDILPLFGDGKFAEFCGKPKIFIFHACQYFTESDVNDCVGLMVDDTQEMSDMLVCFPCWPGVKAKRSPTVGSHYIETLADVLEQKHPSMHLEAMLKEVQERMRRKRFGPRGQKKSINIPKHVPRLFGPHFYFN